MMINGEFVGNKIAVERPKDVGRLFNKSHFGIVVAGNNLYLSLLEGIFLIDEGKIRVFQNKRELDFKELVQKAIYEIPHFEIKYLIFKDLRKRGLFVKQSEGKSLFDFSLSKKFCDIEKLCLVCAFSERDTIPIEDVVNFAIFSERKDAFLWFAIVDEEGDLTYYEVSKLDLKGEIVRGKFKKIEGFLMDNQVIIFNKKSSRELIEKEFFGKPFGKGLQLSLIEALYLFKCGFLTLKNSHGKNTISIERFIENIRKTQIDIDDRILVFTDLKKRGLIVKTGFKFGTHFRVYSKNPDLIHAEYLVHVVSKDFVVSWPDFSRAVRLAHSVNKEIIFAIVKDCDIDYIRFGRLKP